MNERVTFQKNAVMTDEIGNHVNAWEDFYSCFATIGGEGLASSSESEVAGQTVEDTGMTVTVRFCKKAAEITVYSKNRYQLANLLEFGHAKRNGGRTRAFSHIAPAESAAVKLLESEVQRSIK
jgi:SPP1 family predicted phage head-tail adaptor